MPTMKDKAGSQAAMQMLASLGGGAGGGPEMPPEAAGPMGPEMGAPEGMMPEAGADPMALLDQLNASFEGMPQDVATQARSHLNALRELLTQGEAGQEVPAHETPEAEISQKETEA